MFSHAGFLGTKALLYMDIVTIYFALLPFFLGVSIYFATQKKYQQHFISQTIVLALTLIMVVVFEIGVRLTGGFSEYVKESSFSYDFLLIFLIVHIVIAVISVAGWLYQYIHAYKLYKTKGFNGLKTSKHKRIGKALFIALTVNSIMGVSIYYFLFMG